MLKNEHISFDIKNSLHQASFQSSPVSNSFVDSPRVTTPKTNNKNGLNGTPMSHTHKETRKKEKRKIRASSLESSTESDASSAMDIDGNGNSGNPGQVAAVSSTDNFKSPTHNTDNGDHTITSEKQVRGYLIEIFQYTVFKTLNHSNILPIFL